MDQVGLDAETLQQREDRGELLFQHEGEIPRPDGQQHLVLLEDQDRNVDRGRHASDHRAGFALVAEGPHVKRNILVLERLDRLRMDDLRAAVSQFDGVEVVQLGDLHGIGKRFRVGVHHAVHILPHRHRLGVENVGHHGRRVVRAFAPQGRGRAVGRAADEALSDEDVLDAFAQRVFQQRSRSLDVHPGVLVALLGEKTAAHVDPAVRHPGVVQVLGDNRRRDQLAVGHDRVVPQFGVAGFVDGLRRDLFQFAEQRVDRRQPLRLVPQLVDDLRMVLPQRFDMLQRELFIAFLKPLEHLFQGIGRFAHRRNDDEQVLLVVDDLAQIPHSVGIPHRRTSEFIDFHVISLINLTYLPLPFAQLTAVLLRPMAAFTNLPHPKPLPWEGLVATQPGFRPDLQPDIPK